MLWLALHLPLLPLEAFCATLAPDDATRQQPVALITDHRVAAVNAAAAERGVRAGLKRPTALALAGDLLLAESHPPREAAALQAVVHGALAFTPCVAQQDGQTVLLEVQSCLRLFGGLAALQQRVKAALAPLGHRLQMAAAPTALGAALLSQWNPRERQNRGGDLVLGPHATDLRALRALLEEAPVWLVGPGREHWEALQGMGLKTLSDLRYLPRSGISRRFGVDLLNDLGRAYGQQPDPRDWLELPQVFESRLELFARAENTDQVLQGASVLLARLVAWAQARHARVGAFTLRMLHERQNRALQPPTELKVELAEPSLAAAHLQLLLRERLAHVQLAAPTLELRLHCSHIVAGHAPNSELFPTRASETEGMTRLLERLRARLGDTQVQRLVPVADHRPECANLAVPVTSTQTAVPSVMASAVAMAEAARSAAAAPRTTATAVAACRDADATTAPPAHHPAWLLTEPLPLAERDALPLLQGRPLQLVDGPERIESGWWDGHLVARDYYVALTEEGALVWVFRNRLPEQPGEVIWHLQGRFG